MKLLPVVAVVLAGCSAGDRGEQASDGLARLNEGPAPVMVLRMPDSAEVWYTGFMRDTTADGTPCNERTVEIRRAGRSIPVPLLYTLGEMEAVDDTTVRAALVRDCAKYDTYLVNTKTGQPRRAK